MTDPQRPTPMSQPQEALDKLERALSALWLELPEAVATDFTKIVRAALTAATDKARREAIIECARVAETESIPQADPKVDAELLVEQCGALALVQATARATLKSIAERIRTLTPQNPGDAELDS